MEGNPFYEPNILDYPTTERYYGESWLWPSLDEIGRHIARDTYYSKPIINGFLLTGLVLNTAYNSAQAMKKTITDNRKSNILLIDAPAKPQMKINDTGVRPELIADSKGKEREPSIVYDVRLEGPRYKINAPTVHNRQKDGIARAFMEHYNRSGLEYAVDQIRKADITTKNDPVMKAMSDMLSNTEGMQKAVDRGEYIPPELYPLFKKPIVDILSNRTRPRKK